MELKYFRLIKTIAEEGNMANSSEKLFLTLSALSHQLKDLEERLGFKVFHRSRNRWTLTREGEKLYDMALALFKTLDEGFDSIRELKEGAKGNIRFSAECHSFFHELPAFVQKMGLLYPEIRIDLSLGATHQTLSQMLSDEIDVALVTTKPESEALHCIPVFEDEIVALIHREHPLNERSYLDAGHFAELHLIINSFPLENVSVFEHYLKPNKVTPQKVSAIPFTEISLKMVEANMGVMCCPRWSLAPFKLSEELAFKRIGKHGLKRAHHLVVKAEKRNTAPVNNFVNNFLEDFSRQSG